MALLSVAGHDANEITISMPRIGVWHADAVVNADAALSGSVSIATSDGAFSLTGTATPARSGTWIGSALARIVAGAGGLGKIATPRFYRSTTLRIVLSDLLGTAGETLSSTADSGTLGQQLATWTTTAQPVGQVIGLLMDTAAPTASWRMLSDGTFWCGPETWPTVPSSYAYDVVASHPNDARIVIGADAPLIVPGMALPTGEHVSFVEHRVGEASVRSTLWLE